jgi:hypothetical protein
MLGVFRRKNGHQEIGRSLIMNLKLCAFGLVLLTGCGNSATITRHTASPVDAKIIGGDRETLYVELPGGRKEAIPKREVVDIDHPGNVAATIGGIVGVYGAANIVVGMPECDRQGPAYCMGVFLPAAIGISLFAYGLGTYSGSMSAMDEKPERSVLGSIVVAPTHEFAGLPKTPGVSVGGSF